MATTIYPPAPYGMRHPRLSHHFAVRFAVELSDPRPGDDELVAALGQQLVAVDLSPEQIGVVAPGTSAYGQPRPARLADETTFTFEDDVTGLVARGLDLLARASRVRAVICSLDGNEGVIEAWWATLTLRRTATSPLDYAGRGLALSGTMSHPTDLDAAGNPHQVQIRLGGSTEACRRLLVVTTPRVYRAVFDKPARVDDVLSANP
jgi:hypothetical protein